MCGIIGCVPKGNIKQMSKALKAIKHRGPDGEGSYFTVDNRVGLGHVRLSILDLSELGRQPMEFDDFVITYNGEVFNFIEIKTELKKLGYRFNTETDTEVIVRAYEEWGKKCIHRFNGMWAFVIFDKKKDELFISRDRFGIKPLYYFISEDKFVFASEAKAIFPYLESVEISKDFDWCKKNVYYYEGTNKCLIDGIQRFPPGYNAIYSINSNELKLEKYWETKDHLVEVPETYEEQVEEFQALFFDACKIRMRADVPLGTALSGGLDSSAVSAAMTRKLDTEKDYNRISKKWQKSFVASFPGSPLDETKYAKSVVDHLGLDGYYLNMSENADFNLVGKYINIIGEIYSTSPIPMIELYKNVKANGVKVTLDGQGADEALSGYVDSLFYSVLDKPFNVRHHKEVFSAYDGTVGIEHGNLLRSYLKVGKFLGVRHAARIIKMANQLPGLKNSFRVPYQFSRKDKSFDYFTSHLYELFHKTILRGLLRNYDRYSMIAGVESRMPFMDYRVVQYLFSISVNAKIRNGYTKSIVRDAVKDFLPRNVVFRKQKVGFNTPIASWMTSNWKEPLLDIANSKELKMSETVDGKRVKRLLNRAVNHKKLSFGQAMHTWTELTPYLWEKHYLLESKRTFENG